MALVVNFTLTPTSGGQAVALHGATGQVFGVMKIVERFHRTAATAAGYQLMGQDVRPSPVKVWHALANLPAAQTTRDAIEALAGSVCKLTYKDDASTRVMVTEVMIDSLRAVRGSAISGTTPAAWLIEATITMEVLP